MLPELQTYEKIFQQFRWKIPEYFNMGNDICAKFARKQPRRTALISWQENKPLKLITYEELHNKSNALANALAQLGLRREDRVGIILPQSFETALSHIAIYKSAAIAVPLARLFAPDALAYRLKHSGARFAITNVEGFEKLTAIKDQLPDLETVLVIDGAVEGALSFHEIIAQTSEQFEPVKTKADDPALIIYTSGTTGPPKGALHAHRVLLGHIPGLQIHHEFIPQPGDIAWTPADWAWAGGLLNILMPCLYLGVPVVFGTMHRFDPDQAFQLMADTKTTCTFIPPTALRLMKNVEAPAKNYNLSLRTIGSGGESLGRETCLWAKRELGIEVNEFYGQTECNLVLSGFGARNICKYGTIGKPVPGHQVILLNENGDHCKPGETGEVAIKSPDPIMFLNYWRNDKATREKFRGEWMTTGDQCFIDEQGYYHFVGRDDDIISSAGFRLGPGEIEDCLNSHPLVKMAVAVAKPDALRGDIVKAYIVLREGYDEYTRNQKFLREIQLHVKQRLAANIYPREIEVVEEIPLTTTGKVIRRTFRQRAIDETR